MVEQISPSHLPANIALVSLGEGTELGRAVLGGPELDWASPCELHSGCYLPTAPEQIFEAAFAGAAVAMLIVDVDYRIVAFNRASERLTGWAAHEALGRYCWEVCHCSNDHSSNRSGFGCPLAGGARLGANLERGFKVAGREIAALVSHQPLLSKHCEGRYCLVTARELPDSRETVRIEPDVVAAAAHELLSPLNLVGGYVTTLLQFDGTLTPGQKENYLRGIEAAASRAMRMMKNFLNMSRLDAGALDIVAEPVCMVELLRNVVTEVQQRTTIHTVTLRHRGTLPPVVADRDKVAQVLNNLLVNAVKYSPRGGEIRVSASEVRSREELVAIAGDGATAETPCLIVSVEDSGVGIPDAELERVFEKFHRVGSTAHFVSGVGLGLHISKLFVEAHGGRIWARSKHGAGSTFFFTLPIEAVPTDSKPR